MTPREQAIKAFIKAGGVWPLTRAAVIPWVDTGRWIPLAPRYAPIGRRL